MKSSWTVLWIAFAAGVMAVSVQFSIPPVLPLLRMQYHVSYTESALLMSLFSLATLFSSIPGGFMVPRFGPRSIGLWGLGILFAGLIGCYFAPGFLVFVLFRIIQGIGFGLVSIAAPSAIGQFIAPAKLSIAMGIWSAWVPFGSSIMFLFAPKIVLNYKMNTYWILLMVILAIVFFLFARTIPRQSSLEKDNPILSKTSLINELKNANLWWAGGGFAAFTFSFLSFNTWITTVLVETSSMSLAAATFIPSLVAFFAATSNLFAGFIYKKLGHPLLLFILPPLVIAFLWPVFSLGQQTLLYSSAIIVGALAGFAPAILFTSIPLLAKRKETIGIGMSILTIGQNTGGLIGPQLFGFFRQYTGHFVTSFFILLVVGLFTVVATLKIWRTGIFGYRVKKEIYNGSVISEDV